MTLVPQLRRFLDLLSLTFSGYYLPDNSGKITKQTVLRKTGHIFDIAWKSGLFYALFCIVWNLLMNSQWSIREFIRQEINWGSIIKFFLSTDPFVYAHLWYLLASLFSYCVFFIFQDRPENAFYLASTILLLTLYSSFAEFRGFIGLNNYYALLNDATLVVSNIFILRAMPFFLLGIYLKKAQFYRRKSMPFGFLLALVFFGSVLAVFEEQKYGTILMYVGTHVTVIALSLISIWYSDKQLHILAYIGNQLSMNVYIYHIAVGKTMDLLATKLHLWENYSFKLMRPILVIVCSLLLSQLIWMIKSSKYSIQ